MSNAIKLTSPHKYPERILLFGGGGVGKTHTVLNIASHLHEGEMWVMDGDYSGSYIRAIDNDFPEMEGRVHVEVIPPDWADYIETLERLVKEADPAADWIAIDPHSSSWEWAQDYVLEQMYGDDMLPALIELKKTFAGDARGYSAAKANMMNWDLVKKEYNRVWRAIQRWGGNMVLVCEAREIGSRDTARDEELKMLYGPLGVRPGGNQANRHAMSTNLYLDHPKPGVWRATTIKDRNRDEMDRMEIEDFGMDYLAGVAGWEPVRRARKKAAVEGGDAGDADAGDGDE